MVQHRPIKKKVLSGRSLIYVSLLVGILLNMMDWGLRYGVPDFVAFLLLFWAITEPRLVGLVTAFLIGMLSDVQAGSVLGHHALLYTCQTFIALNIYHRMEWLSRIEQISYVLPIFFLLQLLDFAMYSLSGSTLPQLWFLVASFTSALLWPPLTAFITFLYDKTTQLQPRR